MIRYTTETLWHFSCGECKKWWSIGDHQISNVRKHGETMTCPHCGVKQEVVEQRIDTEKWNEATS